MYSNLELMQTKLKKLLGDYSISQRATRERIAEIERLTGEVVAEEDLDEEEKEGGEEEKKEGEAEEKKDDEKKEEEEEK